MPSRGDLRAQPGDDIRTKFNQLLDWIEAQRLISTDARVTVTPTANGQHVHATQPPPTVVYPLLVSQVGQDGFRVAEGYINGRLPLVMTLREGEQPLVDPDGKPHGVALLPRDRPMLVVAEVKFRGDLGLESVKIVTKRPAELLRTGTANYVSAGEGTITGHIPLAFTRGSRFLQFTLHHLQVRAYDDAGTRRVIYWPA